MTRRQIDDEDTVRIKMRLLSAFNSHARTYQEVGESMGRWLAGVRGRPVVLVVEDDEAVLQSYRNALGEECVVLEARDGIEASDHVERSPRVDLVILDLLLPIGSGVEVARQLRRKWPVVPVLVVSGYIDEVTRKQLALVGGPFEYHPKPGSDVGTAAKRHLT